MILTLSKLKSQTSATNIIVCAVLWSDMQLCRNSSVQLAQNLDHDISRNASAHAMKPPNMHFPLNKISKYTIFNTCIFHIYKYQTPKTSPTLPIYQIINQFTHQLFLEMKLNKSTCMECDASNILI